MKSRKKYKDFMIVKQCMLQNFKKMLVLAFEIIVQDTFFYCAFFSFLDHYIVVGCILID